MRVILEQPDREDPSLMVGRCDHYAQIWIRTRRPRAALVSAEVTAVDPHRTTHARMLPATIALPIQEPV